MSPIIIGAIITGSLTLAGAVGAAVITARKRPRRIPVNYPPSEVVALFELATATAKSLAYIYATLGGLVVLAALAVILVRGGSW